MARKDYKQDRKRPRDNWRDDWDEDYEERQGQSGYSAGSREYGRYGDGSGSTRSGWSRRYNTPTGYSGRSRGRGERYGESGDQSMDYERQRGQDWEGSYSEPYPYQSDEYGYAQSGSSTGRYSGSRGSEGGQYRYGQGYGQESRRGDYEGQSMGEYSGSRGYQRGQSGFRQGYEEERRNYAGHGPKGWQRSDERIREDVNETLARHSDIDPSDVEVKIENGVVTLEGTVQDRWMKRHMEDVVYSVFGVQDVHNRVSVSRTNGQNDQSGNQTQSRSSQSQSDEKSKS